MITLTSPTQINSVLGGNVPISYNKLVISSFTFDTGVLSVSGILSLTSTSDPEMQQILGTLNIDTVSARLRIAVPQLDFYRRVALSGPQNDAVMTIVRDAQDALEGGLISLGVVDGTQVPGA